MKYLLLVLLSVSCAQTQKGHYEECDFRETELAVEACKSMKSYQKWLRRREQ